MSQARLASFPSKDASSLPSDSPKDAQENYRANTRKNHISQMSVTEINKYLQDPILKQEIVGQLMHSDRFEVEQDYLGNPIKVTLAEQEEEF